jgi:hypothetical protein
MRPGLTGIGSIVFRDEESIVACSGKSVEECYRQYIGPYKAKLEKWYLEKKYNYLYFVDSDYRMGDYSPSLRNLSPYMAVTSAAA